MLEQHGFFFSGNDFAGPLWTGRLWTTSLVKKMLLSADDEEIKKFLRQIAEESRINCVGFYDIHSICKKNKLMVPKRELLISKIRKKGFKASQTHFSPTGIRSDIELKTLISLIKTKSL